MALSSFDLNLRLNDVLVKKAMDEFDSRKVSIEEMKTFIRYRNFNLGQDAKLVADVFKAYQEKIKVPKEN
jgi:hypothetical protein